MLHMKGMFKLTIDSGPNDRIPWWSLLNLLSLMSSWFVFQTLLLAGTSSKITGIQGHVLRSRGIVVTGHSDSVSDNV